MENFWKLRVVQRAHQLVIDVYRSTERFPVQEKFGLVSQMRRAAISIVANIAEASKRRTLKDKRSFYNIADGSLQELKYYLILSTDLKFINEEESKNLIESARQVGAMLYRLSEKSKY